MKSHAAKSNLRALRLAVLSALAVCGMAVTMNVQAANSVSTNATATVLTPIAITKQSDLIFGRFSAGASGGTVILDNVGGRTKSSTVILASGITPAAAAFTVTGEVDATYTISLPATVTITGAGPDMVVSALTPSIALSAGLLTLGTQSFTFGGTLTSADGATQTAGAYTGAFNVSVDYN